MSKPVSASPRLTVAMIVRNAEDTLGETLDSVRELADEIVVVDTGSTDDTPRIAQRKATQFLRREWLDDFSAARNAAIQAAGGDWILWLDAGETLSVNTVIELREFIDRAASLDTAYYLIVRTPAQGMNIAGEQIAQIRLHPRIGGVSFQGRVRESLQESLENQGLKAGGLSWVIERGMREHDADRKRTKAERNLRIARIALQEEGSNARLLNCMGEACQSLGDANSAVKFYRDALAAAANGTADMLEAYYGLLTALEGSADHREAQLTLCMQALEHFPLDAQLLCALGGYLQAKGQLELASRSYKVAAEHGQLNLEIWHLDGLQEIAVNCHALSLQLLGQEAEATELLERELAEQPNAARIRRQLLDLHVKHGRRDAALSVVNGMPRNISNREALRSAVRGACLAAAGNMLAARSYLETAFKSGCRDVLCLRWLAAAQIAAGSHDLAAGTLEEWRKVDPRHPELHQLLAVVESVIGPRESAEEHAKGNIRIDDHRRNPLAAPSSIGVGKTLDSKIER